MSTPDKRYLALDVFRGADVALMIVVNSLGSSRTAYSPLLHARWDGFTLTDLVFPTFLFVVGNSMSFSLGKYQSIGNAAFLAKVLRRTAVIFLLGYLMYWFPFVELSDAGAWIVKPFSHTRVFGVLQRIALCYLFAALILHYFKRKTAVLFSIAALVAYWGILVLFGNLTLQGNAVLKLDLWLLGPDHLYHGEGVAFDPEGLLSTIPAIVNVIAGYLAGSYIQRKGENYETVAKLLMIGAGLIVVALSWHLVFPMNKKLWTSPFVLNTVGIDLVILAVLVYSIDLAQNRRWTYFFEVFGRNTLFIYLLSELFVITLFAIPLTEQTLHSWIYQNLFRSWASDYSASLFFAVWVTLTCWFVGYVLDKRHIHIKV